MFNKILTFLNSAHKGLKIKIKLLIMHSFILLIILKKQFIRSYKWIIVN